MANIRSFLGHLDSNDGVFRRTRLLLLSLLYLIGFAAAEVVTYYVTSVGGVFFLFAILLSLIVNGAFDKDEVQSRFWLALGLVPLIRIVSLVTPIAEISAIFWFILIAIPIFIGIIALVRILKLNLAEIGLTARNRTIQVPVAISGIGFGIIDYLILKPEALVNQLTISSALFPALVFLIFTGFMEEIAFRGVIQKEASVLGSWGWVYIAPVYAVLQIGQGSALHCLFDLGIALFFGWIVKKTGSIWGVGIAHGLLNIALFLVFPFVF